MVLKARVFFSVCDDINYSLALFSSWCECARACFYLASLAYVYVYVYVYVGGELRVML